MVVSFDVFDTALVRKTYLPIDIFGLVEEKVGKNFKELRIKAEQDIRKEKSYYNIDDIYSLLPGFDKNIEIDLELENCLPNKKVKKIYDKTSREKIFISDMYLSSDIITRMLKKCGYNNPIVFVSCEHNACKSTGELFTIVEKILNKKIDKHYGDNYTSDILGAKRVNIKPLYVQALANIKTSVPEIKNSKLRKMLIQSDVSTDNINNKVATYFSPLIYDFTAWILNERNRIGKDKKILFNARDGYLPYIVARDIFKAKNIEYIEVSRKSMLSSAFNLNKNLNHPSNKAMFKRLILSRANTVDAFLKSIDFDMSLKLNMRYKDLEDFVLKNQGYLYKFFEEKRKNAKKYLDKFNIKNGDMMVDIGYFGTIQYAVEKTLGLSLKGYYLQTSDNQILDISSESYLKRKIIKQGLLIETLFSSDDDGVYNYSKEGNPIYYKDNKFKKEFSKNIINKIVETCKLIHKENIKIDQSDIENLMIKFIYYPTLEQCQYCNDAIFENGDIENFESISGYDREKIMSGNLQECYNMSYWREAFVKLLQNDPELAFMEKYIRKIV